MAPAMKTRTGQNRRALKTRRHQKTTLMSKEIILTLNAGSSSLKFALFTPTNRPRRLWSGAITRIGLPRARFRLSNARQTIVADETGVCDNHGAALAWLLQIISGLSGKPELVAVGHRVVHGGADCDCPKRVSPALMEQLRLLIPLAPLHLPANLAGIDVVQAARPDLPQVACFDTSFHHDLPHIARMTGLPRHYGKDGVRRFGFHGLSYEFILDALRQDGVNTSAERIIIAHLGNGASMVAIRGGKPIETTMGFSTLSGLPMGTRSGDLDPGILLHLIQEKDMKPDEVSNLLYKQSGLLGVSGLSRNMQDLLNSPDPAAEEAVEFFCYQARLQLARLTGALGGLTRVVFTGGIGQNAPFVRAKICTGLDYLGVTIDSAANSKRHGIVSQPGAHAIVEARATDEEKMIARHVADNMLSDAIVPAIATEV